MPSRWGVLAVFGLAIGCGQLDTAVGVELAPEASAPRVHLVDASSDADASDAAVCTGDLSGVDTGDFRISLTVTTTQAGLVAIVNQRQKCAPSVFWDIRMDDGVLSVEVDDGTHYTKIPTTGFPVNDGKPHDVVVVRTSGTLTVYVDGAQAARGPSLASLTALPAIVEGNDVCVVSSDGTIAFVGEIADLCVTRP